MSTQAATYPDRLARVIAFQAREATRQVRDTVLWPLNNRDFVTGCVIGGLLAVQFLISSVPRRSLVALNIILFVGMAIIFPKFGGTRSKDRGEKISPFLIGGLLLVLLNIFVTAYQRRADMDLMATSLIAINECVMLGTLWLAIQNRPRNYLHTLVIVLVVMVGCFAMANFAADKLGFASAELKARENIFDSRFVEGQSRWQAPLYSSWQLSGLLRWTVPVAFVAMASAALRQLSVQAAAFGMLVLTGSYIMVKVEYRFGFLPLAFAGAWLVVRNARLRAPLVLGGLLLPFVIPVFLPVPAVQEFLITYIGEPLSLALGQDATGIATMSNRAPMWEEAWKAIFEGECFWIGRGQYSLDASMEIGFENFSDDSMFRRMGFHQGLLDFVFMYGLVACLVLAFVFLRRSLTGLARYWASRGDNDIVSTRSLALLVLAVIGISNSADGFFLENNWTLIGLIACLDHLGDTPRGQAV
jgi:hypothetical protein